MNEGSALLLQQVQLEPRSPIAAAALLASLQGAVADAQFVDHVTLLLLRFEELGLVERLHP